MRFQINGEHMYWWFHLQFDFKNALGYFLQTAVKSDNPNSPAALNVGYFIDNKIKII